MFLVLETVCLDIEKSVHCYIKLVMSQTDDLNYTEIATNCEQYFNLSINFGMCHIWKITERKNEEEIRMRKIYCMRLTKSRTCGMIFSVKRYFTLQCTELIFGFGFF